MHEFEKIRAERRERWLNPTITVFSENAYHLVGSPSNYPKRIPPIRFKIYKDANGRFIIIKSKKRIYEDRWIYSN